jgi:4-amino-4-deoxy-L-arabinose transferase-like glycosyltransferase
LLFFLILLLFSLRNLPWNLDNYDQAKQAFASRDMLRNGAWLYQHTPSGDVATKPPLMGWVSASLFRLTGSWSVAWRLPSFFAAVTLLLLLYRAGERDWPGAGGVVAAAAFGLNQTAPRLATLVRTDMLLALMAFLPGWIVYRNLLNRTAATIRQQVALCLALTVGLLLKGPVIYAFLLPGLLLFACARPAGTPRAAAGPVPWLLPLLPFVAWAAWGMVCVPGFYDQVVLREFAGRFDAGGAAHASKPVYYYLPHLLLKFAPWSLAVAAILAAGVSRRALVVRTETLWLLCWAGGGLLAMSLVPSKRVDRIFPVIPPLCLLLAATGGVWHGIEQLRPRLLRAVPVLVLAGVALTTVHSAARAGLNAWHDESALARFGREAAVQAADRGRRLATLCAPDEGLALYTGCDRFLETDEAIRQWRDERVGALVCTQRQRDALAGDLRPFDVVARVSKNRPDAVVYCLLTRRDGKEGGDRAR